MAPPNKFQSRGGGSGSGGGGGGRGRGSFRGRGRGGGGNSRGGYGSKPAAASIATEAEGTRDADRLEDGKVSIYVAYLNAQRETNCS